MLCLKLSRLLFGKDFTVKLDISKKYKMSYKTMSYNIFRYAPVGIIFLIAGEVLRMDDVVDTFARLGKYIGTILGGLAIHAFVTLPIVFTIGTRNWSLNAPLGTSHNQFLANLNQFCL